MTEELLTVAWQEKLMISEEMEILSIMIIEKKMNIYLTTKDTAYI